LISAAPRTGFHTTAIRRAIEALPPSIRDKSVWWNLPAPAPRNTHLADMIEADLAWHKPAETARLIAMMTPANTAKLAAATQEARRVVGCLYRRTRREKDGTRVQRAEIRFDDVAGCLRTPAGGSSRQTILVVEGSTVRSRLISARETARLMGLPDDYVLPQAYNEAYHLTGDGVVVPVVRHLAAHLFEPILSETA
jgi:DNA (cytosine-5)-methyltransferase 1